MKRPFQKCIKKCKMEISNNNNILFGYKVSVTKMHYKCSDWTNEDAAEGSVQSLPSRHPPCLRFLSSQKPA